MAAPSPYIIDVTVANFQEVIQRSAQTPILLDFWASWCGPCKTLTPILEELAEKAKGAFILGKIDTEANPQIAQYFRIQSIPSVKMVVQGRIVDEFNGALPKPQIEKWLKELLGDGVIEEEIDLIAQGRELLAAGDTDTAIATFNTHLASHPGHPDSSLALARIALKQNDKSTARALLDQITKEGRTAQQNSEIAAVEFMLTHEAGDHDEEALRAAIEADPKNYAARHDLAMMLAGQGRMEEALEGLLDIVIRDRQWEDDKARKSMVQLFEVMGLNDPKTRAWQKRLGRAMY